MRTPTHRVDVSADKAVELRLAILALESAHRRPVHLPGLDPVGDPDFGHDQPYGPMTPWVVANARAMLGLPHVDILTAHMELSAHAHPTAVTAGGLELAAGLAGRKEIIVPVHLLARRVAVRVQERRAWRTEIEARAEDLGLSRREAREYLAGHLDVFAEQVLRACAVEDAMPLQLRLRSLGAWRCITSPTEDDPGPEWRCSDLTAQTLKRFFADMDEDTLIDSVNECLAPTGGDEDALLHRLIGSTLVRAAAPPPLAEIVGAGLTETLSFRGGRSIIDQLARLVAALCEPPDWLSQPDLATARGRVEQAAPIDWPS
jgi:hypothetical protein